MDNDYSDTLNNISIYPENLNYRSGRIIMNNRIVTLDTIWRFRKQDLNNRSLGMSSLYQRSIFENLYKFSY